MNTIRNFLYALLLLLAGLLSAMSADEPKESSYLINAISVSPYATVGFADFDGKATGGAGLDIGFNLSKTVEWVNFVEADGVDGQLVDRLGGGLQITGKLGKWLRPFARMSVGYSLEPSAGLAANKIFLRPQFGTYLDIWKYHDWHASLTGSWALDVDTGGNASQRLFGGIALGRSF